MRLCGVRLAFDTKWAFDMTMSIRHSSTMFFFSLEQLNCVSTVPNVICNKFAFEIANNLYSQL